MSCGWLKFLLPWFANSAWPCESANVLKFTVRCCQKDRAADSVLRLEIMKCHEATCHEKSVEWPRVMHSAAMTLLIANVIWPLFLMRKTCVSLLTHHPLPLRISGHIISALFFVRFVLILYAEFSRMFVFIFTGKSRWVCAANSNFCP